MTTKQKITDGIARVSEIIKGLSPAEKKAALSVGLSLVLLVGVIPAGEGASVLALIFGVPFIFLIVHRAGPRPLKEGWHKDPDHPKLGQRYYDGEQWTEHLVLTPPQRMTEGEKAIVGTIIGAAVGVSLGGGA